MTVIDGVRMEVGPTILLASGHYFDLVEPARSTFTPHDLILGVSRECRFANQCTPRYSVGEHSVKLAGYIWDRFRDAQLAWDTLWHDSPEGIIRDIPRPQKMLLPDYKTLERVVEPEILGRLRVRYPLQPVIKEHDLLAQYCEKAQVEPHRSHWPREREPEMLFQVDGWNELAVRSNFYEMAFALGERLGFNFDLHQEIKPGMLIG